MGEMALGVDLGWASQLEAQGFHWVDDEKREVDVIEACRRMGADAVRLRLFVDPPESAYWQKDAQTLCMLGYCDAPRVLEMSRRVRDQGMRLMLDFHYSDHFADPVYQHIPAAWADDDEETLVERVFSYTKDVLARFADHGIRPDWVQVGNEINPGIMHPRGSLREHPAALVRFLNAGYEAVKECCPDCAVITHLAGAGTAALCIPFLDNFFERGGKTDILAFSYYPYWVGERSDRSRLGAFLREFAQRYRKPVMIAEVGGEDCDAPGTCALIEDCIEAVRSVPEHQGLGVFYWEPEVCREILPDRYPLGAARLLDAHTLQLTEALCAYQKA